MDATYQSVCWRTRVLWLIKSFFFLVYTVNMTILLALVNNLKVL